MSTTTSAVAGKEADHVALDGSASIVVPPAHIGALVGNDLKQEGGLPQGTTAVPSPASSSSDLPASTSAADRSAIFNDGTPKEGKAAAIDNIQGPEILPLRRFLPIFAGLMLAVFVVSIDNTVVATAQVRIAEELNGQTAIAWLPTTFLIGQASFSIFFGQTLAIFSSKSIWLVSLFLFELGSVVSGVAPNMNAMLAGRTVSGVGAAGIFMSAMQILAETTAVTARAQYMGILGALFSISMVAGPLIGGALTDHVTWRWVFYINLPIGAAAWLLTMFLFPWRAPLGVDKSVRTSLWSKVKHIDIVGTTLFTGLVCMLVIPIQQAHENGWTTVKTWAPIAFSIVVIGLCAAWFRYLGEQRSLMPLRLFGDLNFVGCAALSFFTFWNAITYTYLFPLFYQTVRGHSATQSGVDMLALMITLALCSLLTGVIAKNTGHYYPQTLIGPLFGIAGAAVLYFQRVDSSLGYQVGTQILIGMGTGAVIQMPILTVQANIEDRRLLAKATSFIVFSQRLGGGVGSSVSGAIVAAQFPIKVGQYLPAGSDAARYARLTPEMAYQLPLGPQRDAILRALTRVISYVYVGGVPVFAVVWLLIIFTVRIKNIKTQKVTRKSDLFRQLFCIPRTRAIDAEKQAASEVTV